MSKERINTLDGLKATFIQDLCDYYNVSNEDAIKLGTRDKGRKPSLPGSKTCASVSNMTYEDIWDLKSRDTIDGIFEFYKDQGSWSAFRQVVRHLDLRSVPVKVDQLPVYHQKLDLVLVFEVLEHVPSPIACIKNIHEQMNVGGHLVENFINHEDLEDDGPDLMSAKLERQQYYDFLKQNFTLLGGGSPEQYPNATRIWRIR